MMVRCKSTQKPNAATAKIDNWAGTLPRKEPWPRKRNPPGKSVKLSTPRVSPAASPRKREYEEVSRAAQGHTNFVTPGTATGGTGSGTSQSYRGGDRSSFEFIAISQVIALPVYAAMRAMIANSVLLDMYSPLLIGRFWRMLANNSSCSTWYRSLASFGASYRQFVPPASIRMPPARSERWANPL